MKSLVYQHNACASKVNRVRLRLTESLENGTRFRPAFLKKCVCGGGEADPSEIWRLPLRDLRGCVD